MHTRLGHAVSPDLGDYVQLSSHRSDVLQALEACRRNESSLRYHAGIRANCVREEFHFVLQQSLEMASRFTRTARSTDVTQDKARTLLPARISYLSYVNQPEEEPFAFCISFLAFPPRVLKHAVKIINEPSQARSRDHLDVSHDRRERIIKASRDITAASKKLIFAFQRVRTLAQPLPPSILRSAQPYYDTIGTRLADARHDLRGVEGARWKRQISGGLQEFVEAETFRGYLESGRVLGLEECRARVRALSREAEEQDRRQKQQQQQEAGQAAADETMQDADDGADDGDAGAADAVDLAPDDYLLGIYDMTGELMRFAVTAMATSQTLPSPVPTAPSSTHHQRTILTDMRTLRAALESLDFTSSGGPLARDVEKKAEVMRTSVEKVEKALYGLVVRGAERPKGWLPPDEDQAGRHVVEVEG
nr:translin-associated protein x [Quercus suber]